MPRRGRPEANCPSRPFCDYRFRCVHGCRGGLGRGGRGFRHARHVPCVNAEEHLRHSAGVDTSDWLIHPTMFPRISLFYQSEHLCGYAHRLKRPKLQLYDDAVRNAMLGVY